MRPAIRAKSELLLASAFLLSPGCGPSGRDPAGLASVIPGDSVVAADLGAPYDRLSGDLGGTPCVRGTAKVLGGTGATFAVTSDASTSSLSRTLSGSVGISVPIYPMINATGEVDFASNAGGDSYRRTFVATYTYQDASLVLAEATPDQTFVATLTPEAQPTANDQVRPPIRAVCGDEYVTQIDRGMLFMAAVTVDFRNTYDRSMFGGAVGAELAGGLVALKGLFDRTSDDVRKNAVVTIALTQKGGQPERLLNVLPEATPSAGSSGILQCSLEDSDGCAQILRRIDDYLVSDLPGQASDKANMVPISYLTAPYLEPPLQATETLSRGDLVRLDVIRGELQAKYLRFQRDDARLKAVRMYYLDGVSPLQLQNLAQLEVALNADLKLYAGLIATCWQRTDECLNDTAQLESGEQSYASALLAVDPRTFSDWCEKYRSAEGLSIDERTTVKALLNAAVITADRRSVTHATPIECDVADYVLNSSPVLDLSHQALSDVGPIASLTGAFHLNLAGNNLSDVSALVVLPRLATLDLQNNMLSTLTTFTSGSWHLNVLHLEDNQVSDLSPLGLAEWQIAQVFLDRNPIEEIPGLGSAPALRTLSLNGAANLSDLSGLRDLTALTSVALKDLPLVVSRVCPIADASVCIWQ